MVVGRVMVAAVFGGGDVRLGMERKMPFNRLSSLLIEIPRMPLGFSVNAEDQLLSNFISEIVKRGMIINVLYNRSISAQYAYAMPV